MRLKALLPLAVLGAAVAQVPMGRGSAVGPAARRAAAPQAAFTELKAYLNLTDAQIEQIRQVRQQSMESVRSVVQQMQEKHRTLREMLEKGTSDANAVGKLLLETQALRQQVEQARQSVHQATLGVLTSEQKTKLAALEAAAKLGPAIRQAGALGLLTPPEPGTGGLGLGLRRGRGPDMGPGMGLGPGMGPGMGAGQALRLRARPL